MYSPHYIFSAPLQASTVLRLQLHIELVWVLRARGVRVPKQQEREDAATLQRLLALWDYEGGLSQQVGADSMLGLGRLGSRSPFKGVGVREFLWACICLSHRKHMP